METGQTTLEPQSAKRFSLVQIFQYTLLILIFTGLVLWSFWDFSPNPGSHSIVVYGFSILRDVMAREILPTFQHQWQTKTGERVQFITSFAGSGSITDRIIQGVPAQIAILSTESDALRLVEHGILPGPTWKNLPHAGE